MIGKKVLSFTVDAIGDNINATISTFDKNGKSWKLVEWTMKNPSLANT